MTYNNNIKAMENPALIKINKIISVSEFSPKTAESTTATTNNKINGFVNWRTNNLNSRLKRVSFFSDLCNSTSRCLSISLDIQAILEFKLL